MTDKEFRKYRNQAGILIGLIVEIPREYRRTGWRIYEKWKNWKITYREAKQKLEKLAKKHKHN